MAEIDTANDEQDNTNTTNNNSSTARNETEAKLDAKYERKKANSHKNAYKRMVQKTKYFS